MAPTEPIHHTASFQGAWRKPMGPKKKQTVRFQCGPRFWEMSISTAVVNSVPLQEHFSSNAANIYQPISLDTKHENVAATLIQYLETGTYTVSPPPRGARTVPIHHAELMTLGIRFQINGLGRVAKEGLASCFDGTFWETTEFAESIQRAYSVGDVLGDERVQYVVRRKLLDYAAARSEQLLDPSKYGAFERAARSVPDFTFDLLIRVVHQRLQKTDKTKASSTKTSAIPLAAASNLSPGAKITAPRTVQPFRSPPTTMQPPQTAGNLSAAPPPKTQHQDAPAAVTPKTSHTSATSQPAAALAAAPTPRAPTLKRKRTSTDSFEHWSGREKRQCTICTATFTSDRPFSRDDIYTRQCRTCADQLERVINFDEHDEYGRRFF